LFTRSANAGHVARSAPLLRDLHLASRCGFEELAERSGNAFGLVQKGLLMLCKSAHALEEESKLAEMAQALGVPAEVLAPEQAARLDPGIRMEIAGAVYFPQDCHLAPQKLMAWLMQTLEESGVGFRWNTEVTGWRTRNGRIEAVRTSQDEV